MDTTENVVHTVGSSRANHLKSILTILLGSMWEGTRRNDWYRCPIICFKNIFLKNIVSVFVKQFYYKKQSKLYFTNV